MNFWNQLPLFRLLIPIVFGVLCSIFLSVNREIFTPLLAFFFLLFLLTIFLKKTTNKYRNRWMFGFSVYLLLFAFSLFITAHYQSINYKNHFSNFESDYCIAKLSEDAIEKAKLDLTNINCKQVIIDSSVPKYNWEQIKKECLKWDIPFYNVSSEGAFLFEFTST